MKANGIAGCWVFLLLLLALPIAVKAQSTDTTSGFTYTTDGKAITITRYIGSGTVVAIPEKINGLPVTAIGDRVFFFSRLTHIEIPNNVTSIGQQAFCTSTKLTSLTIPASITNIGNRAFATCQNLTCVYFKGNVPSLGSDVFDTESKATVYYVSGTTGWGKIFSGRPTTPWTGSWTGECPIQSPPSSSSNSTIQAAKMFPADGDVVSPNRPLMLVRFSKEHSPQSIKILLDGLDVTSQFLQLENGAVATITNMNNGTHVWRVEQTADDGRKTFVLAKFTSTTTTDSSTPIVSKCNLEGASISNGYMPQLWVQAEVSDPRAKVYASSSLGDEIKMNSRGMTVGYLLPMQARKNVFLLVAEDSTGTNWSAKIYGAPAINLGR